MRVIGESIPYVTAQACTIIAGDHIAVIRENGTAGIRYLKPGVYAAGEIIPGWRNTHSSHSADGPNWREMA